MLRTRLFLSFALLLVIFGLLSGWFGVRMINQQVISEAQNRVRLDLESAWDQYHAEQRDMRLVLELVVSEARLAQQLSLSAPGGGQGIQERLEEIRGRYGMDFIGLTDAEGRVLYRGAAPYTQGDSLGHWTAIQKALAGEEVVGSMLLNGVDLEQEAAGLRERSYLLLEDTLKARPTTRKEETRGMLLLAAVPVRQGPQVLGVLYSGILLNRNGGLVDYIAEVNYGEDSGNGTVTIFLDDSRIATTVRKANGNRAIGTRVSREVAETVLDNGRPWIDRAYVVRDWYLTAYDPIRDMDGEIAGMLYVGMLEKPYRKLAGSAIYRYTGITLLVALFALIPAFFFAGRLARPLRRLVQASRQVRKGSYPEPVPVSGASREITNLTEAFNKMLRALRNREASLNEANTSLQALNRNYMETLGYVTHEMNTPIAAMLNYVYMLQEGLTGELNPKQEKAVRVIDHNTRRLMEMVRHYLNLSRIEKDDMKSKPIRLLLNEDLLTPLAESFDPLLKERDMQLEVQAPDDLALHCDLNQMREVFDNLLGNAIKYGHKGGQIRISAAVDPSDPSCAALSVWNEGHGIQPEQQEQLFKKFSRLEIQNGGQQRERGTGLGLFITRHIIRGHGGEISVKSEAGKWIEFNFTLPRNRDEAPPRQTTIGE